MHTLICDVCFHTRPVKVLKCCMHSLINSTVGPDSTGVKLQNGVGFVVQGRPCSSLLYKLIMLIVVVI